MRALVAVLGPNLSHDWRRSVAWLANCNIGTLEMTSVYRDWTRLILSIREKAGASLAVAPPSRKGRAHASGSGRAGKGV